MPSGSTRRSLEKLLHRKTRSDASSPPSTAESSSTPAAAASPNIARTAADKNASRSPYQGDLDSTFQNLTLNAKNLDSRGSSDSRRHGAVHVSKVGQQANGYADKPRSVPIYAVGDPYASEVADRNILRNETVLSGGLEDSHAIRRALEQDHRLPDRIPPRTSSLRPGSQHVEQNNIDYIVQHQLEPLPREDYREQHHYDIAEQSRRQYLDEQDSIHHVPGSRSMDEEPTYHAQGQHSPPLQPQPEYLVKDSDHPVTLDGVVDLRNTENTDTQFTYAPAVTHETVRVDTHEIRHEVITREIHNHDVFHRILPINDIEVLPPRHFIPTPTGGLYEISPEQAPGGVQQSMRLQRAMQEAASNVMNSGVDAGPRNFSARTFEGDEGERRVWQTDDGPECSEQTWIHPPTLETGAQDSGQSVPFSFGNPVPIRNIPRKRVGSVESDAVGMAV